MLRETYYKTLNDFLKDRRNYKNDQITAKQLEQMNLTLKQIKRYYRSDSRISKIDERIKLLVDDKVKLRDDLENLSSRKDRRLLRSVINNHEKDINKLSKELKCLIVGYNLEEAENISSKYLLQLSRNRNGEGRLLISKGNESIELFGIRDELLKLNLAEMVTIFEALGFHIECQVFYQLQN